MTILPIVSDTLNDVFNRSSAWKDHNEWLVYLCRDGNVEESQAQFVDGILTVKVPRHFRC